MLTRREFSSALGASGLGLAGCATMGSVPDGSRGATSILQDAMSDKAVPGMAAMVLRNFGGGTQYVAGERARSSSAPIALNDRWHLGSNGKAMTATLVARLVEAGALSWERPLAEMLPELAQTMRPPYRSVTLPDLLSHRSGLPENTSDTDFFLSFHTDTAPPTAQRLRYIARCLQEAPVGPARGESSYSNTGFLIAAACAERATGHSFEDLMVGQVFAPLGIRSISFDQFGADDEPRGHVDGRIADRQGDVNPRMFTPAGAMRMTLRDWSRFCVDHMRGEHGRGRLLRAATYRFLHAPQGETSAALGWGAAPHPMGLQGPALAHSGSDGNWFALVCLFPWTGNGVLVVANAAESMGGDAASVAVMRALAATVAAPFAEQRADASA